MEQANYTQEFNAVYSAYFSQPAAVSEAGVAAVEGLIQKFPFCQSLRFIRQAALRDRPEEYHRALPSTAVYAPEREVLYALMHHAEEVIRVEELADEEPSTEPETASPVAEPELAAEKEKRSHEEEKLIMGNIAGGDFFAFERSRVDPLKKEAIAATAQPNPAPAVPETSLSKYDDDQMPYTFLWWLSKTRMEHAHSHQPYASLPPPRVQTTASGQLNHQIIENIFHLRNQVDESEQHAPAHTVQFQVKHKEDKIIEKFIREEPQIKPPTPEKIDNENKARKSSEDANDIVTETLAKIYVEQMLYAKAVDTYKKLRLKFPEKSTYFADRISELEKKVI